MSHWVYAPKVEEVSTGYVLLDLTAGLWHLLEVKEEKDLLTLTLLQYPGNSARISISIHKGERLLYLEGKTYDADSLKRELNSRF